MMRFKILVFSLLSLIIAPCLLAQTDHAWIGTGKVKARITPTGIHRDAEGGFLLENAIPGQPSRNLLSHLTPWIGGLDPGNNLKIACEMDDPMVSDWQAGFRGVPNSGKVWKVTIEQIEAHVMDFEDNGIIDHPIAEIFAWPAVGNPFSMDYNGFSMDSIHYSIDAPFYDLDWDGIYSPQSGEFPFEVAGVDPPFPPQILVYSPFYDKPIHDLTDGDMIQMDLYSLAFTLDCQEKDFVENAIFFEYCGFLNTGQERLDSLFLGVFADFDIGNPADDYLGGVSDSYSEMIYCYNADTLNDDLIGVDPPVISINCNNYFLDENDINQPLSHFMPIFPNNFPFSTRVPGTPDEFYNYLTGTWRDGTPLSWGGIGYNPGTNPPLTPFAFPDNPLNPDGWSERAAENPSGNRKCIFSYGPTKIKPYGHKYKLRFALTTSDKGGLTQKLLHLNKMNDLQRNIEYGWDGNSPLDSICFPSVAVKEIVPRRFISPNPANEHCSVFIPDHKIVDVLILNSLGQKVPIDQPNFIQENEVRISLKNLPAGIYFLHWKAKNGQRGCEKLVKN